MRARYMQLAMTALLFFAPAPLWADEVMTLKPRPMPESMKNQDPVPVFDAGTGMLSPETVTANVNGQKVKVHTVDSLHSGTVLPDGQGGYIWIGSNKPMPTPNPAHAGARELKLKIRELADQLLGSGKSTGLSGTVAMPTSFVNQDNFEESSSFGRYIAEQMYYEFNQRGFPVREYRMGPGIVARDAGEFLLSRHIQQISSQLKNAVFLVGTYYNDRDNVFVNARLIRSGNGMVLRSGQLVFAKTAVAKRMLAKSGPQLRTASVSVEDFEIKPKKPELNPIDLGADVH